MTTDEKLDSIIIPELDFEDAPLSFVLDWLRLESHRLDEDEPVPARRGVQIGWLLSDLEAAEVSLTIAFHDCDLRTGLTWIAEQTGLELFINEGGVYFRPPQGAEFLGDDSETSEDKEGALPAVKPDSRNVPGTLEYLERLRVRQGSADRALALCPAINDPYSPEGQTYTQFVKHYQKTNDPILHNDDVPYIVALLTIDAVKRQRRLHKAKRTPRALSKAEAATR